ncbi:hypothetical protein QCA50_017769 [Cerrena zonata]|uniref:HNH nuclease domain-containing protein n=1 Tax=Cerrena zonata TaxID=2478898 RepID=A0AAW0FET9_9APHY
MNPPLDGQANPPAEDINQPSTQETTNQYRHEHTRIRGRSTSTAVKCAHVQAHRQFPADGDEADDEMDNIGPLKDLDDPNRVSLISKSSVLSQTHKAYKNEILDPWPRWSQGIAERKDSASGLPLLTPHFEGGVNHPVNVLLLKHVARKICEQYKQPDSTPTSMKDTTVHVDYKTIYTLAQKSWYELKIAAVAGWDQARAAKAMVRSADALREARRAEKSIWLQGSTARYKELFDLDPTELVAKEWLSDELSGPEEGSEETKADKAAGLQQTPQAMLEYVKFIEVVRPAWLSQKLHKYAAHGFVSRWMKYGNPEAYVTSDEDVGEGNRPDGEGDAAGQDED